MQTKERIKKLQSKGLSIKGFSQLSNIPIEILYNITSGRLKNMSSELSEKLECALSQAERMFDYD